jgi:hypothetical protein
MAQLEEERRIAEVARKEREAMSRESPRKEAPAASPRRKDEDDGEGGWDVEGGRAGHEDIVVHSEPAGVHAGADDEENGDVLVVDDDDGSSVDGLDNSIDNYATRPQNQQAVDHHNVHDGGHRVTVGGGATNPSSRPQSARSRPQSATGGRPQSGSGSRPQSGRHQGAQVAGGGGGVSGSSSRPQSAGRGRGMRPDSARPESAKNQLRAQAAAHSIISSQDTASSHRQTRSKYHLRFVAAGEKTADLHIAGDIAWPSLCAQVSSLLGAGANGGTNLEFTYKAPDGDGRSSTVVCSGEGGLHRLLSSMDMHPPKGGMMKCSIIAADEEDDETGGREGGDKMTELRGFSGGIERFRNELENRAIYTPGGSSSFAAADLEHRSVYNPSSSDADASPRGGDVAKGWSNRPPRPNSVTSRPLSAPRSTRSEPEHIPRPSSASSLGINTTGDRGIGGGGDYGVRKGHGGGTSGLIRMSGSGVQGELSNKVAGVIAPGVGPKGVHEKLSSCIALGVLTSHSEIHIDVEYCTARRPSITLRGSSKKYTQYYEELRREVRESLGHWNVEVRPVVSKPRIGAFEVSLGWTHNGYPYSVCLFSKLATRLWPSARLLVMSLADVLPQASEAVTIRVMDEQGNQGIADTHIVIQDPDSDQVIRSAVTSHDGCASLSVSEGMYNVTVQADGFSQWQALLTLQGSEDTVIRLCTSPRAANNTSMGGTLSP